MTDGTEVEWNYDTLRQIAMKLTVDKNGQGRHRGGLRPDQDRPVRLRAAARRARGHGRLLGRRHARRRGRQDRRHPGRLEGGLEVRLRRRLEGPLHHDRGPVRRAPSSVHDQGFFSGKVAMAENFLWTTYGVVGAGKHWDLAAIPSYNGKITAPLNADTFSILKNSKNQDAAFAAMVYLLQDSSADAAAALRRHARPNRRAGRLLRRRRQDRGLPGGRRLAGREGRPSSTRTSRTSRRRCRCTTRPSTILEKYRSHWFTTRAASTWTRRSRRCEPSSRRPGTPAEPLSPELTRGSAARARDGPARVHRTLAAPPTAALSPGAPRGAPGLPVHLAVDPRVPRLHAHADDRDARLHVPEPDARPGAAAPLRRAGQLRPARGRQPGLGHRSATPSSSPSIWLPVSIVLPFVLALGAEQPVPPRLERHADALLHALRRAVRGRRAGLERDARRRRAGSTPRCGSSAGRTRPTGCSTRRSSTRASCSSGSGASGPGIIINMAGLRGIPTELYEAARIDGAGLVGAAAQRDHPDDVADPVLHADPRRRSRCSSTSSSRSCSRTAPVSPADDALLQPEPVPDVLHVPGAVVRGDDGLAAVRRSRCRHADPVPALPALRLLRGRAMTALAAAAPPSRVAAARLRPRPRCDARS